MKNYILIALLFIAACKPRPTDAPDFHKVIANYTGRQLVDVKRNYQLSDTTRIQGLKAIIVNFYNRSSQERLWHKGTILYDQSTNNAYFLSLKAPPPLEDSIPGEIWSKYRDSVESRGTWLFSHKTKGALGKPADIYLQKGSFVKQTTILSSYLNNCALTIKRNLKRELIDSLVRQVLFDLAPNLSAADTSQIDSITRESFKGSYHWSHGPHDFPEVTNEYYRTEFIRFVKENYGKGNFFLYKIGDNFYIVTLNEEFTDYDNAAQKMADVFNDGVTFDVRLYQLFKFERSKIVSVLGNGHYD